MAKQNESGATAAPETAAQAATKITDIDRNLLEQTARLIYIDLMKGEMRGRDGKLAAQIAYSRARDFTLVSQAIREGAAIPEPKQDSKPLFCKVRLWDGSKGQNGEPLSDENGQALFEVQPVDRDAFAPNLPADHPINQRFYPNALANGTLCDARGNALELVN